MSLDIPASHPMPDPARFAMGEPIRSDDPLGVGAGWQSLGDALRYAHAVVGAGQIMSQGWRSDIFRHTVPPGGGLSDWLLQSRRRFPRWLSGKRYARVFLQAKLTGNATEGTVRLVGVNTATPLDFKVSGGSSLYVSGSDTEAHLEVDTPLDYEELQIWLQVEGGDATGRVVVERLSVEWIPLSGSLESGLLDGVVPLDTDELDPDEPLSADLVQSVRDSLDAMLMRKRAYWTWSALEGHSTIAQPGRLGLYVRRVWAPLVRGLRIRGLRPIIHAYCEGSPLGDTTGQIHYAPARSVAWTVPANEPARWYETGGDIPDTLTWPEASALPGLSTPVGLMEIRPEELFRMGSTSNARILSLSIWGV